MKKNSASTILMVLAVIAVLSACVIGALNYTMTLSRNVQRTSALRQATELGDGALEYAYANWREICRVNPSNQYTTPDFANIPAPPASLFPGVSNYTSSTNANPTTGTPYTIANFGVVAVDPQMNVYPNATPAAAPGAGTNSSINTFYYLASADATVPGFGGKSITTKMRRVFAKQQQSPWSYAIFYNDLLEINPGANMKIAGWVHTNGDLYTEMADLTFLNKVDYGGLWNNGKSFAPGDSDHSDTPASPTYPSNQPPARGPVQQPFGIDTSTINATNGTTQTDSQVYAQLIAPGMTNSDFNNVNNSGVNNSYYAQASIRIAVDSGGNIVFTTGSDDHVITSKSTGADLALYNVFSSAVSVGATIQDNREAQTIRLVDIDMSVVTNALNPKPTSGGNSLSGTLTTSTFDGVIYAYDKSGTATLNRGIRLKNGASMPTTTGITVASNNGIYIQGDYNTGQTSSSKTPANANNNGTGNNYVSGYQVQSCAVLGDAVTILSNGFSTSNSPDSNATPTTVNTAIVSGIMPTSSAYKGANSYSGGAENFPRFLENWGGQYITYYGSMVELFQSQQFTGRWGNNNVYGAPSRNWNFDTRFYTNPPPGSLKLYSFVQQRWYVQ